MKKPQLEIPLTDHNLQTITCNAIQLLSLAPQLRKAGWLIEGAKVSRCSEYTLSCRKPLKNDSEPTTPTEVTPTPPKRPINDSGTIKDHSIIPSQPDLTLF